MIALIERVLEDDRFVEIEVDRNDVVSMDTTMSILLLPMMRKFKENNMGYPYNGEDENDPDGEEGEAKWNAVLDEIIWAMEVTAKGAHYDWFGEDRLSLHTRRQNAFEMFGKNFTKLWI
jgi:hypothetical protein